MSSCMHVPLMSNVRLLSLMVSTNPTTFLRHDRCHLTLGIQSASHTNLHDFQTGDRSSTTDLGVLAGINCPVPTALPQFDLHSLTFNSDQLMYFLFLNTITGIISQSSSPRCISSDQNDDQNDDQNASSWASLHAGRHKGRQH